MKLARPLRSGFSMGAITAALVACAGAHPPVHPVLSAAVPSNSTPPTARSTGLPVAQIEDTIGAHGEVTNGVLHIGIHRSDVQNVKGPMDVTFSGSFQIDGDLFFQPLPDGRVLMNSDVALLPSEVDPFISTLLNNGLVFEAFHQHIIDVSPPIWFVHFRGIGDPTTVARGTRAALDVTATPLPQSAPSSTSTPLDAQRLARILHGHASVGEDGVVTVVVDRRQGVMLGGVAAHPETNVSTNIEFKPLGGDEAAAVPDFSMTSAEVDPVVKHMLNDLGWLQGCLYNQETDEHPQLFFAHMLKRGDAYQLAKEIRSGLDLTGAE